MMRRFIRHILPVFLLLLPLSAGAQFKEDAFTQSYNADSTARDTTDKMFSFKEYFGGVTHRRPARIGTLFAGSTVFLGGQQIANHDYWKLPIVYGGIGAGLAGGFYFKKQGESKKSALCFAGAGITYWGMLMDGVACYDSGDSHSAGKATLYSILLPGLGQVYNHELWKVPIYWAGIGASLNYVAVNNKNYHRYKWIHNQATDPDVEYDGPVKAETALYYRNVFRRYRDYSIVATAAFYLLQVIDANVFAYMQDFDVSDDISLNIEPSYVGYEGEYFASSIPWKREFCGPGLKIGLKF